MTMPPLGRLKRSARCYHWFFVWCVLNFLLLFNIYRNGFHINALWLEAIFTLAFGYAFLIDMSTKIWWTADQLWWRDLDYFSIKPMRHAVRIDELMQVTATNHPTNIEPGKPFDRIVLVSPTDSIITLLSFQRREELESLLWYLYDRRPGAFIDPLVVEYMNGGFVDWWPRRNAH